MPDAVPDHTQPPVERGAELLLDGTFSAALSALADLSRSLGASPHAIAEAIASLPAHERAGAEEALRRIASNYGHVQADLIALQEAIQAAQQAASPLIIALDPPPDRGAKFEKMPFPVELPEVIAITKISRKSFDLNVLGLDEAGLYKYYQERGDDPDRIFESDLRQREASFKLMQHLLQDNFLSWELGRKALSARIGNAPLVIALGGDDHFKAVSQLISDQTVLLGVNSDPILSKGAILDCTAARLLESVASLASGDYRLEPWTRLRVEVNGIFCGWAVSEVFVGEDQRKIMSHNILTLEDKTVRHDSSGLIIATGAGSTGWRENASRAYFPAGHRFPPTARYARFVNTESEVNDPAQLGEGVLLEGQALRLKSRNGRSGIISLDSVTDIPFPRGATATVSIDPDPLWVARLSKTSAAGVT